MKTHRTNPSWIRWLLLPCMVSTLCGIAFAKADQAVRFSGYVAARSVDCFNPKHHHHDPEYFLVDDATGRRVPLKGYNEQLQKLHPRQKVSIRGMRRSNTAHVAPGQASADSTKTTAAGSQEIIDIQTFEVLPMTEPADLQEPPSANGANSLTMLSTLLVFISTNTHTCMTSETNARNRLFNNATNANMGMQAITKGRYGLQLGNGTGVPDDHTIDLLLNLNSADHNTDSIEIFALSKLFKSVASGGMGLDRLAWNRILLFAPGGIADSTFTAYADYPYGAYTTSGMVSMYGNSYGNSRMNGYLHELGHNFGFAHSSKGGSEYGDRTCVMGTSNDGTRTETYNAVKLLETDWLNAFSNAKKAVSTDTTIDLYPLSSDPNIGTIAVSFPGTDYYAAYHRNQDPYGYLSQTGDRDRLFVYTRAAGSYSNSYQVANLAVGGSYVGPGAVIFERYGPNNEYATVSFDMNDGNTKPLASAQSVNATINTAKPITLTGSDADNNPLTFTKVNEPANGVLSGTIPNLTYTPNNNYLGADSFVFKVHDGKISSFATISITVNQVNVAPVANNQSVNVFLNTPEPITLSATDANGQSLIYSVVSGPGKGVLSGTPPNLTYTPGNNLSGSDSFTFKANDGLVDSNTATVAIHISPSPNTPSTVHAGADQTIYMQTVTSAPGLYYGTVPGNIDITTPNPQTQILVDVSSKTEDAIAGNTTEIYTGNIFDADGLIRFTEYIDDKARIWIDGNLVINNDVAGTRTSSANLNLTPGWHAIEIRISNGSGGSGPVGGQIGIGYDPTGGTTWQKLIDPGNASFLRVNTNINSAVANLSGLVTDPEQSPTYSWSNTGTGTGTGPVTFSNANALNPTATFTQTGTYILRLTANDGYVTRTDDITITVNPPLPTLYATWAGGTFGNPFNNIGTNDNPDGDSSNNLLEFAFGTNPTLSDNRSLATDGSANGQPIPIPNGNLMELYFIRRDDHGTSGSVNYSVLFSSDLVTFYDTGVAPTFVANSSANSAYEVVKVAFPASLPNSQPAKFARVSVVAAP